MVQKGIHPLLNTLRVVMRNGASFTIQTTLRRSAPYMLQTVGALAQSLPTPPPLWLLRCCCTPLKPVIVCGLLPRNPPVAVAFHRQPPLLPRNTAACITLDSGHHQQPHLHWRVLRTQLGRCTHTGGHIWLKNVMLPAHCFYGCRSLLQLMFATGIPLVQRVMSRYEGFVVNDQEEAAVDPAAASPSSSSSSGGKSKK